MDTQLSSRLKELRKAHMMSAKTLIKKVNLYNQNYSEQSVYKWENGMAVPDLKVIKILSHIFHCNISYLIEERNVTYKSLTPSEIFLLHLYQNDSLFRSIAAQIIVRFERDHYI